MKECSDEELLCVFNVPPLKDTLITPKNYNRSEPALSFHVADTLIRTYGKTAFVLIETVVDVIVSHSPQTQTNKLYMEAMGILLTLFSRMMRNVPLSPSLNRRTISNTRFPRFLRIILRTSFSTFCSSAPECRFPPKTTPNPPMKCRSGRQRFSCRFFAE